MNVIKKQSKNTYKDKNGKERHYYNYYLVCENGKSIQIRCAYVEDYARLDMLVDYVK